MAAETQVRITGHIRRIPGYGSGREEGGGYGFIRSEEGDDYFVSVGDVQPREAFAINKVVTFVPIPPQRGEGPGATWRATKVRPLGDE